MIEWGRKGEYLRERPCFNKTQKYEIVYPENDTLTGGTSLYRKYLDPLYPPHPPPPPPRRRTQWHCQWQHGSSRYATPSWRRTCQEDWIPGSYSFKSAPLLPSRSLPHPIFPSPLGRSSVTHVKIGPLRWRRLLSNRPSICIRPNSAQEASQSINARKSDWLNSSAPCDSGWIRSAGNW